jgi:sporulation protein YlmC with PRC-barrel domain
MSLYRDRITAPGLRDNDWAHTAYDDMRLAAGTAGRGYREAASSPRELEQAEDTVSPLESERANRRYVDASLEPDRSVSSIMSADRLAGDEVRNAAGELLGELTDIMIDVASGRVAYGVVSVPGVLGVGDKLFAIPWKSLRRDRENNCFRLDVAKARFDGAPRFDKESWPSMIDERWARRIHAYYKAAPYWE